MNYNNNDIINYLFEINNIIIKEEQIKNVSRFSNIIMVMIKVPVNKKSNFITSENIDIKSFEGFLLKRRVEKINKIKTIIKIKKYENCN